MNDLFFSTATLWEIVIKNSLEREDFLVNPYTLKLRLVENGYRDLSITAEHALCVANLPPIHKDPFDRILLAQAIHESMVLVTNDHVLARYPGPVLLV
jgi:PIN domain nuclease of toxin-antitoxin system